MTDTNRGYPPQAPSDASGMLAETPGGDISWDDLFPTEEMPVSVPQGYTPGTQPVAAPQAPTQQPPQPEDFYLKGEKTVYKSQADAVQGLNEKDRIIEQLRQRHIQDHGVDPLTGKAVARTPAAEPAPQGPVNYMQDRKRYFQDLLTSVEKQDPESYFDTQQKLILDTLAPLAPVIQNVGRQQALDELEGEIKDVRQFIRSEEFKTTLESEPTLAEAIAVAEQDYRFLPRLAGLYKLAYFAAKGRQLPQLLQQQAAQAAPAASSPPSVRPTVQPSTVTPVADGTSTNPGLDTAEGRQAIIRAFESRGGGNVKF